MLSEAVLSAAVLVLEQRRKAGNDKTKTTRFKPFCTYRVHARSEGRARAQRSGAQRSGARARTTPQRIEKPDVVLPVQARLSLIVK